MDTGLLWYDNDPRRGLADRIEPAARRYREKYGQWPNTCFVHPGIVTGQADQELNLPDAARRATIRVVPASNILLHHFWLGISDGDGGQKAARTGS